eukprot:1897917-Pyramimonas_sp.AAC.1
MEKTEDLLANQRRHLAVMAEELTHLDQAHGELAQKVAKANSAKLARAECVDPPAIDLESLVEGKVDSFRIDMGSVFT